ncbi:MAG: sulfotransferase domain-containing protein [Bacteroidota bacterium]|nr:sulfotransferase domain-containing protein [Bacteroidota bacterium]
MKNVLILGSGRSGTSMVTGALADSGYNLGDNSEYLGKNPANPKGFFEDYEVNTINEDILKLSLFNFPDKITLSLFPNFTFYRARWLARIPFFLPIRSNKIINERIKKVISKEPFCFKDPRFSYTLPIWLEFINRNTKLIIVYREPGKTAESIVRECLETPVLNKLKMTEDKALKIWKSMYLHILANYQKSTDKESWFFLHYNQVFEKDKIHQLEEFIDAKINHAFAEKTISRSSHTNGLIHKGYSEIYNQLNLLSKY